MQYYAAVVEWYCVSSEIFSTVIHCSFTSYTEHFSKLALSCLYTQNKTSEGLQRSVIVVCFFLNLLKVRFLAAVSSLNKNIETDHATAV